MVDQHPYVEQLVEQTKQTKIQISEDRKELLREQELEKQKEKKILRDELASVATFSLGSLV